MADITLETISEKSKSISSNVSETLAKIRSLDSTWLLKMSKLKEMQAAYLNAIESREEDQSKSKLEAIANVRLECKRLAEEKISLADNVFTMMGDEIELVDSDLMSLEEYISTLGNSTGNSNDISFEPKAASKKKIVAPTKKKYISKKKMQLLMKRSSANQPPVGISLDSIVASSSSEHPLTNLVIQTTGNADTEEDDDKNVYCLCNRPSFGEMVACENQTCRIEWFHTTCVGLSAPPDSAWFCPECTPMMVALAKKPRSK
jgi:Inhibitor of growth proteins N-terminal histone-binding